MPSPESIIPSSQPAHGGLAAKVLFKSSVSEAEFLKRFPLPFKVQAVNIYDAKKKGWVTDRTNCQFLDPFQYVSPTWGVIDIPNGFHTDFASVPPHYIPSSTMIHRSSFIHRHRTISCSPNEQPTALVAGCRMANNLL
jgi:hypothetical protein